MVYLKCRKRFLPSIYVAIAVTVITSGSYLRGNEFADVALIQGNVATMDAGKPTATAIAWKDGKISFVGSDRDVLAMVGAMTRVIDLKGRLVIPGFIESHAHFSSIGQARMNLDLRDDPSWPSIVAEVAETVKRTPSGEWIVGRGWHQEKWDEPLSAEVEGYPLHDQLSDVTPNHPVILKHASGHMAIVNAKAMELAGIDSKTRDPEGGEILRGADGRATGVLRETAEELVSRLSERAAASPATWRRAIDLASQECLKWGITTFHDAGSPFEEIDRYRQLAESGELRLRMWIMVMDDPDKMAKILPKYRMVDVGDGFLTVRAIKQYIDGALGSHGAWLLEPYEDMPTSAGLNTTSLAQLKRVAELAARNEFQLCIHAIGDRGNRQVLDLYERMFAKYPTDSSRRWRIEHAQHLHPIDIPRFAKLGVIAAMQAVHCTSDAPFVGTRLGQRRTATGAYRWRDLLESGAMICNGTDAPVEEVNPIHNFYASVTRRTASGVTFFADQAMNREQALRSYTLDAAYAAFEENRKGSLAPGKMADVTVLSQDILTCREDEILNTNVDFTFVDGECVFEREPDK